MKTLLPLIFLLPLAALAQTTSVPKGILTTATTTGGANPWIYVRWTSMDGSLPFGTPFAIHLKNGAANASVPLQSQGVSVPGDETAIASAQISRATRLGADIAAMDRDISAYTAVLRLDHKRPAKTPEPPAETAPLAIKLAQLIHQARSGDNRTAAALRQMAIAHPGIALAIGEAWAGPLTAAVGSPVTVELRSFDPVACVETGIAGRITVQAGQPEIMTAPGAPVQVPDLTGSGDRIVKLRWATPDTLRRQIPLLTGYTVWRVTPAAALARGWLGAPPSAAVLRGFTASNPADTTRITDTPLQVGKLFSAAQAADFSNTPSGDPVTYFLPDDNGRFNRDAAGNLIGTAFPDGSRFQYFVAARDLLGREGAVSAAGEGTACTRLAPPVPSEFTLTEESVTQNDVACQCFNLRWKANLPEGDNDTDFYQIFRGSASENVGVDLANIGNLAPLATLAHSPDAGGYMSYQDIAFQTAPAPGTTFWYAIRAIHTSPRPPDNFSALSPQLYGTYRLANAPAAPEVAQSFECPLAGLKLGALAAPYEFEALAPEDEDGTLRTIRLNIERGDPGVAWVEVKIVTSTTNPEFTRFEFDPEGAPLIADFTVPSDIGTNTLVVKAGSFAGAESNDIARQINIPINIPDWTQDNALVLRGKAIAPALGEITTANADHIEMFALFSGSSVPLAASATGEKYFSAALSGPDHKPYVVQANRSGWATVIGAEIAGNRIYFSDPETTAATSYRVIPIITGTRVCMHFADGADGSIRPIMLRLALPPDFGEYRIFRRVDDGNLTLIAQGDGRHLPPNASEVVRMDSTLPATGCILRYFGQTFDKQGQSSPLVPIGEPITLGRKDVAVPSLRAPRPVGTSSAPMLRLEWFCPPEGIERFHIRLDPEKIPVSTAPNHGFSTQLFKVDAPKPTFKATAGYRLRHISRFRASTFSGVTGPVGEGQPLGAGPVFTLDLPASLATRYKITLQAISVAGVSSGLSKEFTFTWTPPPPPPIPFVEPTVAWPQRPLPDSGFWHPLVRAELTVKPPSGGPTLYEKWDIVAPGSFTDYPVGVRIAAIRGKGRSMVSAEESTPGSGRFIAYVFTDQFTSFSRDPSADLSTWLLRRKTTSALVPDGSLIAPIVDEEIASPFAPRVDAKNLALGDSLLPAVLYRTEIPSTRFPSVSGATIQVSPMISKIAADQLDGTDIRDPYIGVIARQAATNAFVDGGIRSLDLFLLDTQPVVRGARYHYTLLRFSPADGELLESIDAGEITIPES